LKEIIFLKCGAMSILKALYEKNRRIPVEIKVSIVPKHIDLLYHIRDF